MSEKSKSRWQRQLTLIVIMISISHVIYPQTLGEFESVLESEKTSVLNIGAIAIDIILVLGAIGVIYAYVTKRQDARDYLIYYLIGLVVLGVLRQTVLTEN